MELSLAALAFALGGWVRPEAPTTAKPPVDKAAQLDFVIFTVNGESKVVRAGEELVVVRGDQVLVKDAALFDRTQKIREVNVVGWKSPDKNPSEDRGYFFNSSDLKSKYSENGRGDVFAVLAQTKSLLHGTVYLKLIEPTLRYAELTVNGKPLTLRDGEKVEVSAKDLVKVEKVVTNLDSNTGVVFQMVEVAPPDYEIRFLRGERPFASIPIKVKE